MFTKCSNCSAIFFGEHNFCAYCGEVLTPVYFIDHRVEKLLFHTMSFYRNTDIDRTINLLKQREEYRKQKREAFENIMSLVEAVKGQTDATRGTAWGLFNAIAEYADYVRVPRKTVSRLQSVWYGFGAQLKQRAWDQLTKEAENV